MYGSFNKVSPGTRQESKFGIVDSKIYVGIIKDNVDVQRMGRLAVYIPEIGTNPDDKSQWYICSYASPFAGATPVNETIKGSQKEEGSQKSYGFWMIPPDLNNQVLVVFINGEPTKGVWFACLYQQNMNHMVPGVASNTSFQDGDDGSLPPVVEYNKYDDSVNASSPIRPRFNALHDGLAAQGLYSDFERGPSSASARRESPSKVFGFNSPRQNTVHIDDNEENEFIRIRTRSGTQILVHETNGYVYINSGNGNSWLEVSDDGIDIYSQGNISMRTEQDFNIRADRNINLDAGQHINMTAGATINEQAGSTINLKAGGKINEQAPTINVKADTLNHGAMTLNQKADTINRDGMINDNVGNAIDAGSAESPKTTSKSDGKSVITTPVSRMPHHEPWPLHPKSKNLEPPKGDNLNEPAPSTRGAPVGPASSMNKGTLTSNPKSKQQKTGDGDVKNVIDTSHLKEKKVKIGAKNASVKVVAAIKRASDMTGVDYGYMMAMAEKESSFDPNAKAGTSSAKGLYQFIDGTWEGMVKKYGKEYGIGMNDQYDPEKNALMGALFARDNAAYLKSVGIKDPSPTQLYMAHFMGAGTAAKVLKGDPNKVAAEAFPKQAAANRYVFYKDGGKGEPRTVREIVENFGSYIEPRTVAYANYTPPTQQA